MTTIIDKFENIGKTIDLVYRFCIKDVLIRNDLDEYLRTLSLNLDLNEDVLCSEVIPYIFERQLDNKTIFDLFLEKMSPDDENIIKVLNSLNNSISGIFEIKKILKTGFRFYNLLNEVEYDVISLVKMTNFRGVMQGQYASCRIFKFENEYYLLEISDTYGNSAKENVFRYLIASIIQSPEKAYLDNPLKEEKIKNHAIGAFETFTKIFNKQEIITDNSKSDDILTLINDVFENGKIIDINPDEFIITPKVYQFFKVSDFDNDYNNFLENSLNGFSSHNAKYDVGFLVNYNLGLYILPFWGTINEIFKTNSLDNIKGSKECINEYLNNDKIPLFVFDILNSRYPNFIDLVNQALESNYDYNTLINEYKWMYLSKQTIYSTTSVLYNSHVFIEIMGFLNDNNKTQVFNYKNIGRNDLCPCGSGKKYKNCCLKT